MVQIIKKISPYNHSRGNSVQYIVIHSTGNTNDTAKNNADYFYRADRQASAHYFVDDKNAYFGIRKVKFSDCTISNEDKSVIDEVVNYFAEKESG